jgi:molybdate transport system substrate-binding protein
VLFVPTGSALKADATLEDLKAAVADGRVRRFAIANPEHAPYGRAAREALQRAGLWDAIAPRLVLGENVSQAAQFATTGGAQGGIFAYSLARSPVFADKGVHVLLPAEGHAPLIQRMVLVKGAGATAREFYRYLQQPAAREVFRRFGFLLPGD